MNKARPRRERQYPQTNRVVSLNFPSGFDQIDGKCFVPLDDYRKLERRYMKMFKLYQKVKARNLGTPVLVQGS